jgi:hypothetical protein
MTRQSKAGTSMRGAPVGYTLSFGSCVNCDLPAPGNSISQSKERTRRVTTGRSFAGLKLEGTCLLYPRHRLASDQPRFPH